MKKYDLTVVIGRFQPLHKAHQALITHAQSLSKATLVLVGSSYKARDYKDPFSFDERKHMVEMVCAGVYVEALTDDLYDDAAWIAQVQAYVDDYTINPSSICIVGHKKDNSSKYLEWFPQYAYEEFESGLAINATDIRHGWYTGRSVDNVTLNPTIANYIHTTLAGVVADMKGEYQFVEKVKQPRAHLTYKPIDVTVDAVVLCAGHVLLIKRKGYPGKGQWAMPGGYLEADEHIIPAALRELKEETGLKAYPSDIKYEKVFSHPKRSLRGRLITHAHLVVLKAKDRKLPIVKGQEAEVEAVKWATLTEIEAMRDQFFEDHYSIIMNMVNYA